MRGRVGLFHEWTRGEYAISTDPSRLDLGAVHGFLKESYWAKGVPLEVVERSVEHSLCFGLYRGDEQVGFARIVTDRATFAYLADVFVLEEHRGRGLGKWLMRVVLSHPDLRGLRRWMLATADAHALYRGHGFRELGSPEIFMEKKDASYGV
jgi:GNAT superfamily N-acetyltransferase